jgi:hypothetical protein
MTNPFKKFSKGYDQEASQSITSKGDDSMNNSGFFATIKSAFTSATKGVDSFCDWAKDPETAARNAQAAATAIRNLAKKLEEKQTDGGVDAPG